MKTGLECQSWALTEALVHRLELRLAARLSETSLVRPLQGRSVSLTRIWVRVSVWDSHTLPQSLELGLEGFVPLDQVLYRVVSVVLALEVLQFPLQAFDMLLCPGPDGTLRLTVIRPLPSKL